MTSLQHDERIRQWFSRLATAVDRRSAPRLALLFLGAVLARGRRTVTTWIRAAGLSGRFQSCYLAVAAAGRKAERIAARLLVEVVKPLLADAPRITLAIDDTPTRRYGPHVQGAGIHHNPTPGPAGSPYVYGHVFVVLAILVQHNLWGVVALPLLASLYVRSKDLSTIDRKHRPAFRTKLEMSADLLGWAFRLLKDLGKPIWVAADGAYAKAPFLRRATAMGMTVVSRLRKDAAVFTVPEPRRPGRRGRPRIYGEKRVDLSKRAGQSRGWSTGVFKLYGKSEVKRYKTFLATWRPAGGVIRVVLVKESTGWTAFFCTDASADAAVVLETVADRFSLEITFRECKEIVGAGRQQVRHWWANVGGFHMCLWTFTMTEAWAWSRRFEELVERGASPWDSRTRRPSHADKRNAWRRELLREELRATLPVGASPDEIQAVAERLLSLAA